MATQPQPDSLFRHATDPFAEASPLAEAQAARIAPVRSLLYRPDIDGLRALAVLGVIFFHAGVPGFGGGYVGVDVFFVISGYLITRLLIGSMGGTVSSWLRTFYLRRARRILPALLVTAAVATAVALVLLLPWDLAEFGKFLAGGTAMVSNLVAWRAGDYFNSAGYMPLVHFWSLAVEEQFYLAYPLVLLLLTRYLPRHRFLAITVLTVTAFALCVWASYHKPKADFFLAPTRAWEFLLGAVVASSEQYWSLSRKPRELLSALAGVTLASSIWFYHPQLRHPGIVTLAPCVATALLIATNGEHTTLVGRLLRWQPLVFTGLISYSLYLWHLPILAFARYFNIRDLSGVDLALALVASYAIAIVSWRLVEKPIRAKAFLTSNRTFLLAAGALSAVLLVTGLTFLYSEGLPQRFDEAEVPHNWARDVGPCENMRIETVASGGLCSYGPVAQAAPRALVWGDSHALSLLPAYKRLAESHDTRVFYAIKPACLPLLGFTNKQFAGARQDQCRDFNGAVARAIERLNPSLVILNAHWIVPDEDIVPDSGVILPKGTPNFRLALEQTVQRIGAGQRSICVVLDVPTFKYEVSRALVMARLRGFSTDILQLSRAEALQQLQPQERDIRMLQQKGLVTTVDPKDVLCRSGWCEYRVNGRALYGDSNHLAADGALSVVSAIDGCFRPGSQTNLQAARRE